MLVLFDLLQHPSIARNPPLGAIHLLHVLPTLGRQLERVEQCHAARIRVSGEDRHGGVRRKGHVERDELYVQCGMCGRERFW